jgi:hypothetical protein
MASTAASTLGGDGKTWVLWIGSGSARRWTATKKPLAFCTVTQDGDDEGCLGLHQLPTSDQAEVIRDVLGIRKRREVSAVELGRLKACAIPSVERRQQ